MSRELLKMALDALDEATTYTSSPAWSPSMTGECKDVAAALRAALAAPVEPVAWAMLRADGLVLDVICDDEHEAYQGAYTVPLYATPPAQPAPAVPDPAMGNPISPMKPLRHSADTCPPPAKVQAYAYTGPTPDCRTCNHYEYTRNDGDSCYAGPCKDGHLYDPLPPLKLWKTK